MSKQFAIAQRIKAMKLGDSFTVATERERQGASKAAKVLKSAGVIAFDLVTKETEDGKFKVVAI
jgi:hypothetical protein